MNKRTHISFNVTTARINVEASLNSLTADSGTQFSFLGDTAGNQNGTSYGMQLITIKS